MRRIIEVVADKLVSAAGKVTCAPVVGTRMNGSKDQAYDNSSAEMRYSSGSKVGCVMGGPGIFL